ncbi:undecaprenyldiphospho-muramoylpentapeptide beta-N-acetylglucosaminyltransferase [Corynebacterium sp. 32222D000AT]|uniref:undecaprenyldiphospho-muramoylpentapeptide beta-N-acetylglucosaminyltransferase n=1 Tax=unclassified Corynebacterium TaxID=2624378 RepID=UPI002A9380C7|nr:undecaprenyldiphospho-muramoylpentapeptide beta-N-acetylglucosaminyltransferase [Mycobacteriaceae bacterium]MDY5830084.1 undecaprenyldiphospho-muramoylpentapeptide beta-N-acetylglucosaminyltransferase [Corynebacterium sp.]
MNSKPLSVVVAGGGTAGHIEPALAVAAVLQRDYGARITALGTQKGLESDLIPARGVDLEMITPVPIPRKLSLDLLKLPYRLVRSVLEARKVLKKVDADAVFGTGGYVAAPAYLAAASHHLPFYVLETNALAGLANKLGVKLGGIGFNAHPNSGMPGEQVGIPVRPELGQDPEAAARGRELWGLRERIPTILVTGGSQGAASINRAVAEAHPGWAGEFQVLHAVGKKNELPAQTDNYVPVPYIDDMSAALAVADLAVCRSGAMTVAEVSAAGVPAIYVPLPHGNGEQALNSKDVVAAGAAVQVPDAELDGARLDREVRAILGDEDRLKAMRAAVADSAAGGAAQRLADHIATAIREAKEES